MDSQERKIGGFKYRMTKLGGITGRGILLRLAQPFAAFLSAAAASGQVRRLADIGEKELALALAPALGALTEADLAAVCDAFAGATVVFLPDGKQVREWPLADQFDEHFAGRYAAMIEWLRWGIKYNDFFAGALGLSPSAGAEGSSSTSPTASTGGNGGSTQPSA